MGLEIKLLDTGDVGNVAHAFKCHAGSFEPTTVPCFAFLILGGEAPILVDTGYKNEAIINNIGMQGIRSEDQSLEAQLAKYDVKLSDIKYVLHTHAHIDHAGQDSIFPMTTVVGMNRRELEYSVSGLQQGIYAEPDVKHLVDRLYTKGALHLFDTDGTGAEEVIPGVAVHWTGGHTEGSLLVMVETDHGMAVICGDIVYDVHDQIIQPWHDTINHTLLSEEPTESGNHGTSIREERIAIKRLLAIADYILPSHDRPAAIVNGKVVGRLHDSVPGPVSREPSQRRLWFRV